ncbi:MAG: SseB family protein [Planctomycetota bacterium]
MSVDAELKSDMIESAIEQRDAESLAAHLAQAQFVLIHVQEHDTDEPDGDDELGALTADVNDEPCLVAFASEEHASQFVDHQREIFADDDEVGGFVVSGEVMLDYLGDEYGLLINPESDQAAWLDRELIADILDSMGLE